MNSTIKVIVFSLFALITGFSLGVRESQLLPIDMNGAQKLIGIEFSGTQKDTMLTYLEQNLEGYDSMRAHSSNLQNDIVPPLYFDPLPNGFTYNEGQRAIDWQLSENVLLPANPNNLAFFTVAQLSTLIRTRKITSLALTKYYIDRIKKYDSKLLSVVTLTEELGLKQAKIADKEISNGDYRGPLHGIPYGIKDLFAVEGYKTTWGAMPFKDQVLDYNAAIVEKLEEAGAVLIAKLTSGALARGDVWFGGQTKNPWDLEQGASGSSAGSGPTYGTVSRFGAMPLSWTMDKPGPICRSVLDCALVFDAIRGKDLRDRTTRDAPFNFQPEIELADLRIGYLIDQFESDTSSNSVNNEKTLEIFRSMGADFRPVTLPQKIPYNVFDIILRSEAGAFFEELVRSGRDSLMVQQDKQSRANSLRQSRFIPAVEYLQANRHRSVLIERMHEIMKDLDVLISPTFGGRQMLITNLTGHPAVAIPNGLDEDGHPTSITLVGNLFDEATILAVAGKFQKATDFDEMHPSGFR